MRAQQQGGDVYGSNPAPTTYQSRRANPYDQRNTGNDQYNNNSYEMSQNVNTPYNPPMDNGNGAPVGFYDEISAIQDEIRNLHYDIDQISKMRNDSLNVVDSRGGGDVDQALTRKIDETRGVIAQIKKRIGGLPSIPGEPRSAASRKPQMENVREKFKEAVEKFQAEELEYRTKYRRQMARQFRIVNPNATDQEIESAIANNQMGPVFAQAVAGNRYQESRNAYNEVQKRHEEVKQIEQNLAELAQLFNDLALLTDQQNDMVDHIEETGATVEKEVETGLGYTDKAVNSARAARKKRWICFFIVLIILIIIAAVVAVEVVHNNNNKSK